MNIPKHLTHPLKRPLKPRSDSPHGFLLSFTKLSCHQAIAIPTRIVNFRVIQIILIPLTNLLPF